MQKMVLTTDRDRLKTLLIETITLLCKNGLDFQKEFSVDALIGITLDQSDVFLVSIKETVKYGNDRAEESSLAHGELNGEKLSDASLPAERVTADFSTNSSLQKPANCPINLDCIVSAENDDPDGRLLPVSALRRKHRTDSGKSYSSPVLLSPGDARVESPSVDADACNVENVLPNVSSQRFLPEEPPRKRQCPSPSSQKKSADQQAIIQDFITQCKSEPVEVIKLENSPVNDSSDQQEDSNFVYDASYGPEMNHGLDPAAFMNWYGHDNLNSASLPGCSSWPSNGPPTSSSSKNLLDQGPVVELVPGSAVYISAALFAEIEREKNLKGTLLVRRLVNDIFPDEQLLAASSCLGKGNYSTRQGLDQTKIDVIKAFVKFKCPTMKERDIVQNINWICGNARRRIRERAKRLSQEYYSLELG